MRSLPHELAANRLSGKRGAAQLGGGVQHPVAERGDLAPGQRRRLREADQLGPADQVGGQHGLQPGAVSAHPRLGRLRRPAASPSRKRSSTRACWRCRSSSPATCPGMTLGAQLLPIRAVIIGPGSEPQLRVTVVRSMLTCRGYAAESVDVRPSVVPFRLIERADRTAHRQRHEAPRLPDFTTGNGAMRPYPAAASGEPLGDIGRGPARSSAVIVGHPNP
jgi:hypothetical protein